MIVYDDLEPSEKVKVYDQRRALHATTQRQIDDLRVGYRIGDMWAPQLAGHGGAADRDRTLRRLHRHTARTPITDGQLGLRRRRASRRATRRCVAAANADRSPPMRWAS